MIEPGVFSVAFALEPRAVAGPALRLHPSGRDAALRRHGAYPVVGDLGELLEER